MFQLASKTQSKLRLAVKGPSGAGKTFSALSIAQHLGKKVAVIDTEYGSCSKYADKFHFHTCEIRKSYPASRLLEAMTAAENAGFDVIIIDSLSHFWNGADGILERVQAEGKRHGGNTYAAWNTVTPIYKSMIDAILASKAHVIACMRAKQDYVQEKDDRGKTTIKKVGMAAEIREGFEYELDIEGILDMDHNFVIGKTRCELLDGKVFHKPGKDVADILNTWLSDGAPAPEPIPEPIDWKARARTLYTQLPEPTAKAIAAEHGQNFEAMCHALATAMPSPVAS